MEIKKGKVINEMKLDEKYLNMRAIEICGEWSYDRFPLVMFNPKLNGTLGQCIYEYDPPLIELNKSFVKLNPEGIVEKVLKHELIHTQFPQHNKPFKKECERRNVPYHIFLQEEIKLPAQKYIWECECGFKITSNRNRKGILKCPICSQYMKQRERKKKDEIININSNIKKEVNDE